ncbi:MAG: DNA starvation/stationary phase protection protein [Nitrosarchaeum sp.]|nr:DNA starvation/stationary phase protection protein [Nitrosarchaeum sp.]
MTNINIGISDQDRKGVVDILAKLLADEYVLYTKTRNYHWNVVGEHFSDYHKMFEGQYDGLSADIDEIAERIRSLGSKTSATLEEFAKNSRLEEHPGKYPEAKSMIQNLVSDHEKIIQSIRLDIDGCGKYNDVGTQDFLTGLMEKHEKTSWMLRSVLE